MSYDTAVQAWIMEVTGYDDQHVFRSQQVGQRPEGDHATYLCIAGQDSDFAEWVRAETDPVSDNIDMSYVAPKMLVYSVNIFASNGEALLTSLWKSRYLLAPRLLLRAENMVLRVKSNSNEVPTVGDTSWRRQYHADFTFGVFTVSSEEIEKLYTYRLQGIWTIQPGDDLTVVIDN